MHSMYGGLRTEGMGTQVVHDPYIPADQLVGGDDLPDTERLVVGSITFNPDKHVGRVIPIEEFWEKVNADMAANRPKPVKAPSTNPKQGVGSQKLPLHLVSPLATAYMAVGLANGAGKYGAGNFKGTEVLLSIYLAATLRHLFAFMEGQEFDEVDGTPHLGAVMANMAIILDARAVGTLVDDRIIPGGYLKEIEKLTEIYQGLLKLHEGRDPFHYTRATVDV